MAPPSMPIPPNKLAIQQACNFPPLREKILLELVCTYKKNKDMAIDLGISHASLSYNITEIFKFFKVKTRAQLTVLAHNMEITKNG
jgi:DNA-binding NarL/FixJ family response regulator